MLWKGTLPDRYRCYHENGMRPAEMQYYILNEHLPPFLKMGEEDEIENINCYMRNIARRKVLAVMTKAEYLSYSDWKLKREKELNINEHDSFKIRRAKTTLGHSYSSFFTRRQPPWEEEVAYSMQRVAVNISC